MAELPEPAHLASPETSYGAARVLTWPAAGGAAAGRAARADVLLQHGANGKLAMPDLVRLVADLPERGFTVRLLQQPFAVAGRRIGPPPTALDTALREVVAQLDLDGPLVLGGRSAGARCALRSAGPLGAVAALALAFPLHPPGRPEKSRAQELLGCTVPVLVVQGTRDTFGGPDELPALPANQEVVAVPGADHGFAVRRRDAVPGHDHLDVLSSGATRWLDRVVPPG